MRRVVFLFVLLLFIPQPMTQLVVNSLIEPPNETIEESFTLEYNPETDYIIEDTIIRITPISEEEYEHSSTISQNSVELPHLSPAIYPSLTTAAGNNSILQRGEVLDVTATTEYELLGYVPVDKGSHYWYDLQRVVKDSDSASSIVSMDKIAIEFSSTITTDIMAISFNLEDITSPIANSLDVYLTDNLNNYQSDYMMYTDISFHSYNSQKNNPNSPLLFAFWNHPLTTPISNSLTADISYYIIVEMILDGKSITYREILTVLGE